MHQSDRERAHVIAEGAPDVPSPPRAAGAPAAARSGIVSAATSIWPVRRARGSHE